MPRTTPPPTTPVAYTPLQGQYLAFIDAYTTLHRLPPAEADMQAFFRVSPPSVHQSIRSTNHVPELVGGIAYDWSPWNEGHEGRGRRTCNGGERAG